MARLVTLRLYVCSGFPWFILRVHVCCLVPQIDIEAQQRHLQRNIVVGVQQSVGSKWFIMELGHVLRFHTFVRSTLTMILNSMFFFGASPSAYVFRKPNRSQRKTCLRHGDPRLSHFPWDGDPFFVTPIRLRSRRPSHPCEVLARAPLRCSRMMTSLEPQWLIFYLLGDPTAAMAFLSFGSPLNCNQKGVRKNCRPEWACVFLVVERLDLESEILQTNFD